MNTFSILLSIHIISGGISLILGSLIMMAKKGDSRHKQLGQIFFIAMSLSATVSIPLGIMHTNYFLLCIGIWTLYMLITGKRFLRIIDYTKTSKIDKFISLAMALVTIVMLCISITSMIKGSTLGYVLGSFTLLNILFLRADYQFFNGISKYKNPQMAIHIQRMCGAFIASLTAFIVVNNTYFPSIIGWLLPGAIFIPLIAKWTRKWTTIK
jgi:uncharacterized membrane protein